MAVTIHGTDLMGCSKWPAYHCFAEEAVAGSERVIAVSADNRDLALAVLPAAADKLLLLPNGYNEDIFYREEVDREAIFDSLGLLYRGEYIVLFAGKLAAFKGVDTLLRVARRYERLAEREIITLIAGDGEERERLSELHKQLGLRNTFFLGNQRQDELRRLYNTADVFVMPSRREPFGLAALEAMACGLPVVASREGGLPEFINSEVGTLVSPEDEDAFCAAILEELTRRHAEPERRDAIAHYARGNFAQAQFVARLEEVYQSAVRDFQIRGGRPYEKNHGDSNLLVPQDRRSVAGGRRRLRSPYAGGSGGNAGAHSGQHEAVPGKGLQAGHPDMPHHTGGGIGRL